METNKKELKKFGASEDCLNRFLKQIHNTSVDVDVASLVDGLNTYGDLLCLAGECLPKERIARFACDCALINIDLIEPHTDIYDLIVGWLRNPDLVNAGDVAGIAYTIVDNNYNNVPVYNAACAVASAAEAVSGASINQVVSNTIKAGSFKQVNQLLIDMFNE